MKLQTAILPFVLGLAAVCPRAEAEDPEHVRPSTGTVEQLRSAVSAASHSFGDTLDKGHDWLYRRLQYLIARLDTAFMENGITPLVAPVSPLRIGYDGDLLHRRNGIGTEGGLDSEATLNIPNLERRLKVFITSDDVQETPGDPALERNPIAAGLRWAPLKNTEFDIGARMKVWPSVFAALKWTDEFHVGALRVYSFAKPYVESGLGLGVSGGVAVDRWDGPWVARSASFADWVRNAAATGWSQTFIAGYARAVIQQRNYDKLADGHDLACGVVARAAVSGDRVSRATLYEGSVLFKRPVHGGWLFAYAGPVVRWDRNFGWHPDIGIGVGFDALFWGLATPPAELAGYCR
jgi:hypothetical protein